ncbi:MAG: TonB-dependent receptor [Bacteroidales bacterium]
MIKTLKRTLLTMVLAAITSMAFSQGTVKGVVVDALSGEPLIGATVVVEKTTMGTSTSLDGSFVLRVPSNKATLSISYIGYIDQYQDVILSTNEEKDLGKILMQSKTIGLEEVLVTTSFVRDRTTPVAVSTIGPQVIIEKLSNNEFPEILKSTPSIYATKTGGGFGDARVYVRGFDSNNVGVLINGIPVNGMEDGKVYWSNWSGLADVTENQQVQRGLGASKLALSSVGGTINIITKSTEAEKGGTVYSGIGNDGYHKQTFTVSTGMLNNGWAVTIAGGRTYGDGYVQGTNFEGYSYFVNISKKINDKHRLVFNAFGAPQWHNQRSNKHTIQEYRDNKYEARWNSDFGYRNGEEYPIGYAYNYYHKPQLSLNHYWKINDVSMLSTQVYASIATGGGRRISGSNSSWLSLNYPSGKPYDNSALTPDGYFDFDWVMEQNAASLNGSTCIVANAINDHQWYGALSTYTTEISDFKITAGFDGRYYSGVHAYKIDDLLGGSYYIEAKDVNRAANRPLKEGDYINYHYLGQILWLGLYAQAEYVKDQYSGFISLSAANSSYRRVDYFTYTPGNQKSSWHNFLPWNVKGGFNYKINNTHNVFVNGGYITKAPIFANAFLNYTNTYNDDVKNEKIITVELGYGFSSRFLNFKVNLFRTNWLDKALVKTLNGQVANITGLDALHQGVEFEGTYKPFSKLFIKGMASYGDYVWSDNVHFTLYDENQNVVGDYSAYVKDVHVGNSAQVTAALGCDYEVLPKFKIGADFNWFSKNYADFDPTARTTPESNVDAWKMPNYYTLDVNANYKFKMGAFDATIYGNVSNLLNTEYVADATDGDDHDRYTSYVFYGFGRTWSAGLKVNF